MPVARRRDPHVTSAALTRWLAAILPAGADPVVAGVRAPGASGFSGDTLFVQAEWSDADGRGPRPLVLRIEAGEDRMFPDTDLCAQHRLMRALAEHTDLPVPAVFWFETDPAVLGAPFLAMQRAPGRAPSDQPPYHEAGWLFEASPAEREAVWWAGLGSVAEVHQVDLDRLGLGPRPLTGKDALEAHLARWRAYQGWLAPDRIPACERAYGWLAANRPVPQGPVVLLWGDARIGNVLYQGGERTAVLDWELASTGPAEIDLAWFLYLDRHHSEGCHLDRLAGLPTAGDTVRRYEKLTGRSVGDLAYYTVLSGYRLALMMCRAIRLLTRNGLMPEQLADDYAVRNNATVLLEKALAEAGAQ